MKAAKQTVLLCRAYITGESVFSKGRREQLKTSRQRWMIPLIIFGLGSALVSYGTLLVVNYRSLYQLGASFGRHDLLLFFALLMSWLLGFILTFTSAVSLIFGSSDVKLLTILPLSNSAVVWAKLVLLAAAMLPLHLFITLPAIFVFGSRYGWSLSLIPGILVLIFAGPVIPLFLSAAAASLLMRFSWRRRFRTAFEVTGMVILITIVILFQSLLTRMSSEELGSGSVYRYLAGRIDRFYTDIPPLGWVSRLFVGDVSGLLPYLLLTLFTAAVSGYAISRLYRSAITASFESGRRISRGKPLGRGASGTEPGVAADLPARQVSEYRQRRISSALVIREWRIIASNSAFVMQTGMEMLVIPILLAVMALTGALGELETVIVFIVEFPGIELLVFGILLLFFLISSVSATSVSREGKLIGLSRRFPVSPHLIARAKVLFHVTAAGCAYLIYLAVAYIVFPLNPLHLIYMVPGGILCLAASSTLSLLIDLKRPLLVWSHPQQAMKQNLNVLISMGVNALFIGLLGGIGYLFLRFDLNSLLTGAVLTLLAFSVLTALQPALKRAVEECYGPQE